jgi:hypothetical protein
MKKIVMGLLLLGFTFVIAQDDAAQDTAVPYFQPPYFERQYSQLELSPLASLGVTLAIREAVQLIGSTEPFIKDTPFTFVSQKEVTTETHDLILEMLQPLYAPGGDSLALKEWLETYYSQEALADEMQIYFGDDFYREALAGSDDYFDTKDFADVLTMYLSISYVLANHLVDGTPAEYDLAAREQVRAALAHSPRFAALDDADKQRGTLLLLFFVSYTVGEFNRALENNDCAANDLTPGPSEPKTLYCPSLTEVDLVGTFTESLAQIFGFRVRQFVMNENGFETKQ